MSVNLRFSANIELGGKEIPLVSPPVGTILKGIKESGKTAKDAKTALRKKLEEGISFGLPQGTEISLQLQEIVDFAKEKAREISEQTADIQIVGVKEISEFFDHKANQADGFDSEFLQAYIKITAFHINTKGAFSISVEFGFEKGALATLLPSDGNNPVSEFIDIESIGLALAWEKPKP